VEEIWAPIISEVINWT